MAKCFWVRLCADLNACKPKYSGISLRTHYCCWKLWLTEVDRHFTSYSAITRSLSSLETQYLITWQIRTFCALLCSNVTWLHLVSTDKVTTLTALMLTKPNASWSKTKFSQNLQCWWVCINMWYSTTQPKGNFQPKTSTTTCNSPTKRTLTLTNAK